MAARYRFNLPADIAQAGERERLAVCVPAFIKCFLSLDISWKLFSCHLVLLKHFKLNLMNKVFQDVDLSNAVIPREVYILSRHQRRLQTDEVASLYTIESDSELVAALDMDVHLINGDKYELRKFLGIKEIRVNTHLIRLLCYDKLVCVNVIVRYFLHRIATFHEELARVTEIYGCD